MHLEQSRRPARPHHAEFYRILPSESAAGYNNVKYMLGAGVEVTKVTLCASFCWKSLSRPSLCNLDSTPPQVINATANDGDPCAGRHSQTSQDVIPSHPGLFEKPSLPVHHHDFIFLWSQTGAFIFTQLKYLVLSYLNNLITWMYNFKT